MNKTLPWDDLRVVLAIASAGSLSGAGRALRVSHATVFRRLKEIEARLGVSLFVRGRGGYTPTVAGEEMAAAARRIEDEVAAVERRVAGRDLRPSGVVRVTTTDTLLVGGLSEMFAAFREAYPDISLEVAVSNRPFNLSRREADVALRPVTAPPDTLVGRKVGTIQQAVYITRDRMPEAASRGDVTGLAWIGPDDAMPYRALSAWMAGRGVAARCAYRVDTVLGMYAAVCAGAGAAVLPCYLGEGDARLVRIGNPIPDLATDLWLLTHADLRKVGRVRAFTAFVAAAVRRWRLAPAGRPEGAAP